MSAGASGAPESAWTAIAEGRGRYGSRGLRRGDGPARRERARCAGATRSPERGPESGSTSDPRRRRPLGRRPASRRAASWAPTPAGSGTSRAVGRSPAHPPPAPPPAGGEGGGGGGRSVGGQAHPPVEFLDQGVDRFDLTLDAGPVGRVLPLGQDFLVGFPLLLDPRVVLQVVDAPPVGVPQIECVVGVLAQQVAGEVGGGVALGVFTMFGMHLPEAAALELH